MPDAIAGDAQLSQLTLHHFRGQGIEIGARITPTQISIAIDVPGLDHHREATSLMDHAPVEVGQPSQPADGRSWPVGQQRGVGVADIDQNGVAGSPAVGQFAHGCPVIIGAQLRIAPEGA